MGWKLVEELETVGDSRISIKFPKCESKFKLSSPFVDGMNENKEINGNKERKEKTSFFYYSSSSSLSPQIFIIFI